MSGPASTSSPRLSLGAPSGGGSGVKVPGCRWEDGRDKGPRKDVPTSEGPTWDESPRVSVETLIHESVPSPWVESVEPRWEATGHGSNGCVRGPGE